MRFCIFCRLLFWVVSWKFNLHLDIFHNAKCVLFFTTFSSFHQRYTYNTIRADPGPPPPFWQTIFKIDGVFWNIWVWTPFWSHGPSIWPLLFRNSGSTPEFYKLTIVGVSKGLKSKKKYFKNSASR